jgi:phenylacetate-CoA ligase
VWLLGLRPRDRVAIVKTIWDAPPPSFDRLQTLSRRLGLVERRIVDCFQPPASLLAQLRAFRPHVVTGYPVVLVGIARAIATEGRDDWTPRMVLTGGESLLHPHRALVRDRFGAPVYDIYGTTECNVAAWECPHAGEYHVCDDSVIVEICRDGVPVAPGETGKVVITSLHTRAMPLIRVALGDEAVAGSPQGTCGLPFPTLREIRGRVIDFLPLPGGRRLHPFELLNVVVDTAGHWVAEYQITQLAPDRFAMQPVESRAVEPDDLAALRAATVELLRSNVRFDIEQVADIARDRSGKLHFCRSLVA